MLLLHYVCIYWLWWCALLTECVFSIIAGSKSVGSLSAQPIQRSEWVYYGCLHVFRKGPLAWCCLEWCHRWIFAFTCAFILCTESYERKPPAQAGNAEELFQGADEPWAAFSHRSDVTGHFISMLFHVSLVYCPLGSCTAPAVCKLHLLHPHYWR